VIIEIEVIGLAKAAVPPDDQERAVLIGPPRAGCSHMRNVSIAARSQSWYMVAVHVITKKRLREFWERHPQAERPVRDWYTVVSRASWTSPSHVRAQFGSCDFVANNRVIFDLGGTKFRIVAIIAYRSQRVFVRFVGTHAEYDRIGPATV
jgi:mRNA interferase HigB